MLLFELTRAHVFDVVFMSSTLSMQFISTPIQSPLVINPAFSSVLVLWLEAQAGTHQWAEPCSTNCKFIKIESGSAGCITAPLNLLPVKYRTSAHDKDSQRCK